MSLLEKGPWMIIDFHAHLFPRSVRDKRSRFFFSEPAFELLYGPPDSRLATREELLRDMDEEGVQKSVVLGFPWKEPDHFRAHNDYIIESVKAHPDRLIGFCCFDPRSSDAPKETERCLGAGISGVGELAMYDSDFSPDTIHAMQDLMDVCRAYDVPVLFHVNEPVGHSYPGKAPISLGGIIAFLRAYPENRIVLAHWGGGVFFYSLLKKEVREVLRNTWFDTAASPYLYRPEVYKVAVDILGSDRIMFGSDYPLLRVERCLQDLWPAGLSQEAIRKILGGNAARLLRLPL